MGAAEALPRSVPAGKAAVSLRQSTPHRMRNDLESRRREYNPVDAARRHGCARLEVIDEDRGPAAPMTGAGRAPGRLAAQHARFVRPESVRVSGPLAMSPSCMAGIRVVLSEAVTPPIEVAASRVTGPEGGNWTTCSMAVYEYLVERPVELQPL